MAKKLTIEETDLIVSILNLVVEKMGYDVDQVGFGYYNDGTIDTADGSDLKDNLEWVFQDMVVLESKSA